MKKKIETQSHRVDQSRDQSIRPPALKFRGGTMVKIKFR